MQGSKGPLLVFASTFATFLIAFGGLLLYVKPGPTTDVAHSEDSPAEDVPVDGDAEFVAGVSASDRPNSNSPPERPERRSWIRGRVVDLQGSSIEGAVVHFMPADVEGLSPADASKPLRRATTGPRGGFSLHPKALPSTFGVVVCADGFARAQVPLVERGGREQLDLGDITLDQGASLLFSVRDDDGRALPHAEVRVDDPSAQAPPSLRRRSLRGTSDQLGVLAVEGADFGSYAITVSKPGYVGWSKTMSFDEEAATEASVDVILSPATARLIGSVADAAGYPVREGAVTAERIRSEGQPVRVRGPIDDRGRFELGPIPDGDYEIRIDSPGLHQRQPLFAEADGEPVRLVVDHGGTAFGRVEADAALDARAKITLSRQDGRGRFTPFTGAARTELDPASGKFEVDGLPPGTFQVRVETPGLAPGRSEPFSLGAGERKTDLEVRLTRGGQVTGRILDARGTAISNCKVTVYEGPSAPPPAMASLFADSSFRAATSGPRGQFELDRLSPGTHIIVLEAERLPPRTVGPVEVGEGRTLKLGSLLLGSGGSISGSLPAGQEGDTVVLASDDGTTWLALRTDAGGRFSAQGLPAGTYRLQRAGRGFAMRGKPVTVELGEDAHVEQDL